MIGLIENYRRRKRLEAALANVAALRDESDVHDDALAELSEVVTEQDDAIAELGELVSELMGGDQ